MKNLDHAKKLFFEKVYPEPNTGCWLWAGASHPRTGHGSLNGKSYNGFAYAHRFSYFIRYGEFDRSLLICHKCDVPWCVNPDHLYVGTYADNNRDIIERSNPKYALGEKSSGAKLNEQQVRSIRTEFSIGNQSRRSIAKKYSVSHTTICGIITGKYWSHVD